jgi:hypothetical protein
MMENYNFRSKFVGQSSWEANTLSAGKEILHLYGIRRFIVVNTRVRHWTLFWDIYIQFRSTVKLYSHICLILPNDIFPSRFPAEIPTKMLYFTRPMNAICLTYLIFDSTNLVIIFDWNCIWRGSVGQELPSNVRFLDVTCPLVQRPLRYLSSLRRLIVLKSS